MVHRKLRAYSTQADFSAEGNGNGKTTSSLEAKNEDEIAIITNRISKSSSNIDPNKASTSNKQ